MPPFPPLTQSDPIPPDMVCPQDNTVCVDGSNSNSPGARLCECVNIIQVQLGQVVEMILIDWGKFVKENASAFKALGSISTWAKFLCEGKRFSLVSATFDIPRGKVV
jgi:hypothetical protein